MRRKGKRRGRERKWREEEEEEKKKTKKTGKKYMKKEKITNAACSHHHHHHGQDAVPPPPTGASTSALKNIKGVTPTGSSADKAPHHHHHHHHHHSQKAGTPAQSSQTKSAAPVVPPKTKTIISSKAVLDSVAHFPRHHLGDFIYEPELKPARLVPNTPTHRGFSSNPKPLPWDMIKDKQNCTLTVKVPRVHLSAVAREEITARAYLWGTDVYTDDSDVVAACIHGGWIKGEWTDDVDTTMLDLENGLDSKRKAKLQAMTEEPCRESEGVITAPPPAGPMEVPANRDLHVNVLILPRLTKYTSCTRYGITSREFGGVHGSRHSVHDGLSYMVRSIRWVENGGQPQARLRGKARRERMRKAMKEVSASFGNIHGSEREQQQQRQQRRQQDKPQDKQRSALGLGRGDIIGSWRRGDYQHQQQQQEAPEATPVKEAEKPYQEGPNSEGDKENRTCTLGGGSVPAATTGEATQVVAAKQGDKSEASGTAQAG